MASRRTARILLVLAAVLLAGGLFALAYGSTPATAESTEPIPSGWVYYAELHRAVLAGGMIEGTWQCVNGTPVQVLVYNDADYGAFVSGENRTALYDRTAVNGTISLSVSGFDTYHVVFQHGAGYENTSQFVSVDLTTTGADPTFTIGGVLAVLLAAVFIVVAARRARKSEAPSGILPSRATIRAPPPTPEAPRTSGDAYRVPPPLPRPPSGSASRPAPAAAPPPAATEASPASGAGMPVGTVVVTVENRTGADARMDLVVNGSPVTSLTVPAGQSYELSVSARLSSLFGSTVTVEAVMANGRRVRGGVFVGAGGTAPLALRIG